MADIRSALAALPAGGTLTLDSGTYRWENENYNNVLVVDAGKTLACAGDCTLDGGASYGSAQSGAKYVVRLGDGATLDGLIVRRGHRRGVWVNGRDATVQNCSLRENGINPDNGAGANLWVSGDGARITNTLMEYGYSGAVVAGGTKDVTFEYCVARGNGWISDGREIFGENGDGLGGQAGGHGGERITWRNCLSMFNSDDGFVDGRTRDSLVENSIAIGNGFSPVDGSASNDGDRFGFKAQNHSPNDPDATRQGLNLTVRNCYAINNGVGADLRNSDGTTIDGFVGYGNRRKDFIGGNGPRRTIQNIHVVTVTAIPPQDAQPMLDTNGDGHRVYGVDTSPQFADPQKPLDTRWQGSARATWENVWAQVVANFRVTP